MKLKTIYLLQFLATGIAVSITVLLPFIAKEMDLSLTQSGFLSSILNFDKILLMIPVIFIANKYSNRKLIYFSMILITLGFAAISVSKYYLMLIGFISIIGFGVSIYQPIIKAELAGLTKSENKGSILSNFGTIGQLGKFFFSATLGYCIIWIGWRQTTMLYSFIPFLIILIMLLFSRKNRQGEQHIPNQRMNFLIFKGNFKLIFAFIASLLDTIASSAVILYLPFLIIARNFDIIYLPTANAIILLGTILGRFLLGRLTDKRPETTIFIVSELLMAGFTLVIAISHNIWLILIICFFLGIVTKGTTPVTQVMVINAVKNKKEYKSAFFLDTLIGNIGSLSATLFFGILGDHFGLNVVFIGFTIMAILAIIPGIAYRLTKIKKTAD
ncbi:MAG: MFS transporter [bacterium]